MTARNIKLLATLYRTEGLRAVLQRLAFRFFHVHTFVVLRMRLSDSMPVGIAPPGIEIGEVTKERLRELRQGRSDLPEYFYRDESGTVGRCWVGVESGRLGFIAWITYQASSGLVRLGENEVEAAFAYCMKELRGKHLTTIAFLQIARTLFGEGVRAMWATPHSRTPAITKALMACGFVRIGCIRRFGFLTWPRTPVDYSKVVDSTDDTEDSSEG